MAEVTTRNRNKGKFYKDGRAKPANWEWRFEMASVEGKRQQKTEGGFKTQKEAQQAGIKAYNQYMASGQIFKASSMSLTDYLDYWLENVVHKNLGHDYAYNTYLKYKNDVNNHIKPALGTYPLASIQNHPDAIQKFIDELKLHGFSLGMIKGARSTLSAALNYAVLPLRYIETNPCIYVKIGKVKLDVDKKAHKDYVCTAEEFKRIIERFPEGSNFYLPLLLPYYCGTRIGETYAIDLLTDVNFEAHTLSIRRKITKQDKHWKYEPPKYDSIREIKIGNVLEKALKREIRKRKENILRYGEYYTKTYVDESGTIIQLPATLSVPYKEVWPLSVRENGELLTPYSFKYCARIIHNELNNPLFHSHCLRHTHGTMLAEMGVNPKTIMERLGHKDIQTTLQTYVFNTEKMQDDSVKLIEKAIESIV